MVKGSAHILFETERLIVRQFTVSDKDDFFSVNGDEEVVRYIRPAKTKEESDLFLLEIIKYSEENPLFGRWAVFEKSSDQFVGSFAVIPILNTGKMQLGYALLRGSRGRGYASELTKAGIKYFFSNTNFTIVYAQTEAGNIHSINVLIKCGFSELGRHREENREIIEYMLLKSQAYRN
jgi:ribosomal-protein-alanine N-acetyltransferase